MTDSKNLVFDLSRLLQHADLDRLDACEFHITREDELVLADLFPDSITEEIYASVLLNGVRATFRELYGITVKWGAERTGLRILLPEEKFYDRTV